MNSPKVDLMDLIVKDIVSLAKDQQKESSNLVSAIHAVWGDVGLRLGEIMSGLNKKEKEQKALAKVLDRST